MSKCDQCIVRQLSSLKALSKEELLKMTQCKISETVKKGTVLFEEGEHLDGVFCIKDGACKLTKLSSNGKDQIIKLIKKGDLLGQRSVISEEPVNLTATALSDMEICFIPKNEIIAAVKDNLTFTTEIIRDVCHELKDANNAMLNMAQHNVTQRLANALLHLENTFGLDSEGYIDLYLSREEIANMIGTATESAIRLLSSFKKDQLIELDGKRIKILDAKKLAFMVDDL